MTRTDSIFFPMSVLLHLVVLSLLALNRMPYTGAPKVTILAVETVPGGTPLGSGSGAPGQAHRITDTPANLKPNPLSGAMKLKTADLPAPQKPVGKKGKITPKISAAQSFAEAAKKDMAARPKIGVEGRSDRGDELSEGGMGDSRKAGTATGDPTITGELGSRGYRPVDWGTLPQLPEESELIITYVVDANGVVKAVKLKRSSGFPEIDQQYISKAKTVVFDPLSGNEEQRDVEGDQKFSYQFR